MRRYALRSRKEPGNLDAGRDHLLEVIEDKQHLPGHEIVLNGREEWYGDRWGRSIGARISGTIDAIQLGATRAAMPGRPGIPTVRGAQ